MEWILVLVGIAYSIWSTYKKDAREREEKLRRANQDPLAMRRPEVQQRPVTRQAIAPTSLEQSSQYDYTSSPNSRLASRDLQNDIRRTLAEVFGDSTEPETKRYRDYDELASYDDRSREKFSGEHQYSSHFKANEGLRKDSFKVGSSKDFEDAYGEVEMSDKVYDAAEQPRRPISYDKASLRSYVLMHEILGKPKALEAMERRRHLARHDARHGRK